ncbi:MAG: hypothetical protein IE914_11480, partial [Thiotrichales bacterium]|nr:hypothetical protein [Thiotrichales bacterium]
MTSSEEKALELTVIENPDTVPEDLDCNRYQTLVMIEHEKIAYFGVISSDLEEADPTTAFDYVSCIIYDQKVAIAECNLDGNSPFDYVFGENLLKDKEKFIDVAQDSHQFSVWVDNHFGKSILDTNGGFQIAIKEAMRIASIGDVEDEEYQDLECILSEDDARSYLFNCVDHSPEKILISLEDRRRASITDDGDKPSMLIDIREENWIKETKKTAAAIKQALDQGAEEVSVTHGYCSDEAIQELFRYAKKVKSMKRHLSIGRITSMVKRAVFKSTLDKYNEIAEGNVFMIQTYCAPIIGRGEFDRPKYGAISEVKDGFRGGIIG